MGERHTYSATGKVAKVEKETQTYRYDDQGREVGHESGLETTEFDDDGNETNRKYRAYQTAPIDRP
jgi:YD repeat-containing protein